MARKQKLELTWIGKDERPKLEPRVLIEDEAMGHAAPAPDGSPGLRDNVLIKGDNLLALKALEAEYAGKVKCVYADPPYNTGAAFKHYQDGLEHSIWLSLMFERLHVTRRLLSENGSIFVQADDNEGAHLKVVMDEVFGRGNFLATFVWRKVDSPNDNKVQITPDHEFIYGYAKDRKRCELNQKSDESLLDAYRGPDEKGRYYRDRLLKKNGKNSLREDRPSMFFPVVSPDGGNVFPVHDDGREARWAYGKSAVDKMVSDNSIIWKDRGESDAPVWVPYVREFAKDEPTRPFSTLWVDLPTTRQTKAHQKEIFGPGEEFDTPKPEALNERIFQLATNPGDLVLDSFAGSGTTGAVAHKMGRRWIMVELGEHANTHIVPRLNKVIDGEDPGGVTEATGWQGGGGYRYFRLAPSLLNKDEWGQYVISKEFKPEMLAEAVCKLMGFTYAPSQERFWQHGHSTERDFIYVTTQRLTRDALKRLSHEVGDSRTLLVCCRAHDDAKGFDNLTVKKIPQAVLAKCEWGRDDYSLNIQDAPSEPITADDLDEDAEAEDTAMEAAE